MTGRNLASGNEAEGGQDTVKEGRGVRVCSGVGGGRLGGWGEEGGSVS